MKRPNSSGLIDSGSAPSLSKRFFVSGEATTAMDLAYALEIIDHRSQGENMIGAIGPLRVGLIILWLGLLLPATAHAQGKWIKLAPFPEPAEELVGAAAAGKMYVFCGLAPGWKPIGMVYEYDPALAPMPTKRGSPVASAVGDKIYVIGGATTPPGSKETAVHAARPHVSVGTVEEYDPPSNTWRQRSSMPTPRNHATAGAINGKIYVIGGRVGGAFITSGSSNVDVVEEYDPATDAWGSARAKMPSARSAMASGDHAGRIYVTGGEGQNAQMMYTFRALEVYDPASNSWTVLPSLPVSRHGLAGAVVGNRLHMVSGDVQSAGTGVQVHSDSHDAFELDGGAK